MCKMCKIGVKTCLIGFKNVQIKMLVYKRDPFYADYYPYSTKYNPLPNPPSKYYSV